MTTPVSYGQLISQERNKQNMSGRQLAAKADIAVSHLNRIENGTGQTTPRTLQRIARALFINPSNLIEAWLHESLAGIDYNPDLLANIKKPDLSFSQIESMYGIDQARKAHDSIHACNTGKKMQTLKQETLLEVRIALKNCLGFIDDLRRSKRA